MTLPLPHILAAGESWLNIVNYEIIRGNPAWRFGLLLLGILATMATGRIAQYAFDTCANRKEQKTETSAFSLLLRAMAKPVYVAVFAVGLNICKVFLYFDAEDGISPLVFNGWTKIAHVVGAVAGAYALYRLVDVIEYYLNKIVSKTHTKLDDMLVPVVRKSLRITIAIISVLLVTEFILPGQAKSLLLSAGVGGIAIALAAKDSIANFFGSITIFADRPFQIDDLVKIDGHYGRIEEVGFRSTRIRTLQGHLVTIPNNTVANTIVENVGRRPFIRRTADITVTYDTGGEKTKRAVDIIKEVLAGVPEINTEQDNEPRIYFSDFNDWSLNIRLIYWVKPPDYWVYQEVNERINFEIMKRFEAEKIEFAFPSQTLYVKK